MPPAQAEENIKGAAAKRYDECLVFIDSGIFAPKLRLNRNAFGDNLITISQFVTNPEKTTTCGAGGLNFQSLDLETNGFHRHGSLVSPGFRPKRISRS
jgi:hypothetical protein